jgi:hypothetical protein
VDGWEPLVIGRPAAPAPARAPAAQPYRPDVVADGWSSPHFEVRCASVRGAAHRFRGEPRQDEFAVVPHDSGALVAVVADGLSAAPMSHLGATMACRTVVEYLLRALDADPDADVDWPDLLRCAGWSLVEYAARQPPPGPGGARTAGPAEPDPRAAERALATTVIVALVRPRPPGRATAALARVGDSAAWVLGGGEWRPVFPPSPYAEVLPDGVAALPRVPPDVAPVEVELGDGDVLLLGTDGFADPLTDALADGGAAGKLFAEALAGPPPMLRLAWLLDFDGETYDDDRTLLGVWPTTST